MQYETNLSERNVERVIHERRPIPPLFIAFLLASALFSSSLGMMAEAVLTIEANLSVVSVYWGTSQASPVEAAPGDRNLQLNVELQNSGTGDVTVIEALLYLDGTPFTNTLEEPSALAGGPTSIKIGARGTVKFNLNVAEGATISIYTVQMSVSYWGAPGQKAATTVNVRVPLLGRAFLRLQTLTLFASPGNNSLGMVLFNDGSGRADRVQAVLALPSPLMLMEGRSQWSLGSLQAGGSMPFSTLMYVPETATGTSYRFSVNLTYADPYGFARTAERSFDLSILKVQAVTTNLSVTVDPVNAPAGITRRLSGRLIRLDTGSGVSGEQITLEIVDPRTRTETRNYTTGLQGYWEDNYMPSVDGGYTLTARFEGGPSAEGLSTVYGPSRTVASLNAALAVSVSCAEPWQVSPPGGQVTYNLRAVNQGSTADRFQLGLAGLPSDFDAHFYAGNVEVKAVEVSAGSSKDLRLLVTLPEKPEPGTYRFQVELNGSYATASFGLITTVEAAARGITLSSPVLSLTAATGETLSYPIRISNLGGQVEQVYLTMNMTSELLDWKGSFSADGKTVESLPLGARESRWVVFRALPPYLVKVGHYALNVYAATAEGQYSDSLQLDAELLGSYRLEIAVESINPIVYTGEKTEVKVTVMNRGLSPVTSLGLNATVPRFLTVSMAPVNVLSLAAQEDMPFLVTIRADAMASTGEFEITFTAISREGMSTPFKVPVSVQSSIPWFWISVGLAAVGAGFAALAIERLLYRLQVRARREQST